jgi:tRNA-2-methylthio-N6-dimethylallyladenosine synthase
MRVIERIKAARPDMALSGDFIVGFPGETDADFEETLEVVRMVGFDDAYTFKFSPRDGTPATRMPVEMTVTDEVATERLARLIDTVRRGARERNMMLLGAKREVLVEKGARRGELLQTRTRDFKTVLVPGDDSMIGRYITVELTGTTGSTFTGAVCHTRERAPLPMAG